MIGSSQSPTLEEMDSSKFKQHGKITVGGYIDAYYIYDFNKPTNNERPYSVSMSRHNEMTINLAYIEVKYNSPRLRARFAPGVGTYMNANYVNESGTLKNILEASAGFKLLKSKSIWLDFGEFGSPYTNESAISKDQLTYTRSMSAENSPYYLAGMKVSVPLSEKINGYLYLVNGWQEITDANQNKSLGTQLEFRPNTNWQICWSTYIGNEHSNVNPEFLYRYFSDFYFIYSKGKWSATSSLYVGQQDRKNQSSAQWWQANLIARYELIKKLSISGRVEYFDDPKSVIVKPKTGLTQFKSCSYSVGLNANPIENALFRCEWRSFFSPLNVFERNSRPVNNSNFYAASATIWF